MLNGFFIKLQKQLKGEKIDFSTNNSEVIGSPQTKKEKKKRNFDLNLTPNTKITQIITDIMAKFKTIKHLEAKHWK